MRIKTKLALGLAFLFGVVLLVGAVGAIYLNALSRDAEQILKDNYESIDYARSMCNDLETGDFASFAKNLALQEDNVTEIGERELTAKVRSKFEELRLRGDDPVVIKSIRTTLYSIIKINMDALVRKNEVAQGTAHNALVYIGIIGSFCFLITFTFIVNFPGYIANPISELTEGIKKISGKNYDERLNFKSNDEFGELAEAFNSMALRLEEFDSSNLAQILFEKKRIETIINKMNDPIIGLDEKKKVLFVNTEALKIVGKPAAELMGFYAPDIAVKNDLFRSLIKDVMDDNLFPADSPVLKIFLEGKESYFKKEIIRVTSLPTGESKVISLGFVIILKNVTSFKELDLAKTNFIATISHELKTPLAAIQMCSQLLEDSRIGAVNDEQHKIIQTVKDETDRLIKITSELLNLAQVETGKLQFQFQAVPPNRIIEYAVDALKFQAHVKRIRLEIQSPPGLPDVQADLNKTSWVMVNFLSNAIEYSPEDSKIIISAERKLDKIVFSVRDFGKGIDAGHLDHIFDKFYKAPGSVPFGTGLGLAISKDFIVSENGRVWVESTPGKGSVFSFELDVLKVA